MQSVPPTAPTTCVRKNAKMPRGLFLHKVRSNAERFWSKVHTSDDCWIWTAHVNNKGYGQIAIRLADGSYKDALAHRFAYELLIGPIPDGKILDHVECDNPRCVNPGHVVPTTHRANILRGKCPSAVNSRKTHCVNGHPFDQENTWTSKTGMRQCRACDRELHTRKYHAERERM